MQLRYSNAIILGDIRERIKILAETGQCLQKINNIYINNYFF